MNVYNKLTIIVVLFVLIFYTCTEDEMRKDYPRVVTLEVTNITSSGSQFNGELLSKGNEPILEYGFYWGASTQSNYFDTIILGKDLNEGKFSTTIKNNWEENYTYFIKAYVKTSHYTSTGKWISFVYLGKEAPVITSVWPEKTKMGDTLIIYGKNFSYYNMHNIVYFNNVTINPFFSSDTLVKVIVPFIVEDSAQISLEKQGNRTTYYRKILIRKPVVEKVEPQAAYPGDTISIYFAENAPLNAKVTYGIYNFYADTLTAVDLKITKVEGKVIKFIFPNSISSKKFDISVSINNFILKKIGLSLANPIIEEFSDDSVYVNDFLKITGKGFIPDNTLIYFNGSLYNDNITVSNNTITLYPNSIGKYKVTVSVFKNSSNSKYLTVYGPEFSGLSKTEVFPFDTVILYGKHLIDKYTNKVRILYDYYKELSVVSISADKIQFIVPYPDVESYELMYQRNYSWSTSTGIIMHYKMPEVKSISKSSLRAGDTVIVKGKNFLKYKDYYVSSSSWSSYVLLSVKDDEVIFYVKDVDAGPQNVYLKFGQLSINLGEFQHYTPYDTYSSKYFYGFNSTAYAYYQNKYFYFNLGMGNTNYSINTLNNSSYSQSITTIQLNSYNPRVTKTIEDNWLYYFVRGNSNEKDTIYSCKIDMNTNAFISNTILVPKKLLNNFIAFRLNGYSYLGPDVENNFWRIGNDNIAEIAMSLPVNSFSQVNYFVYNNEFYLIIGQEIYVYISGTNQWSYIGKTPVLFNYGSLNAILDGKVYLISNSRIWRFDPTTNLWQWGTFLPSGTYNLITSENGKIIIQEVNPSYGTYIIHYYPENDFFVNYTK